MCWQRNMLQSTHDYFSTSLYSWYSCNYESCVLIMLHSYWLSTSGCKSAIPFKTCFQITDMKLSIVGVLMAINMIFWDTMGSVSCLCLPNIFNRKNLLISINFCHVVVMTLWFLHFVSVLQLLYDRQVEKI